MDRRPLGATLCAELRNALRRNVDGDVILMDRGDTSFIGVAPDLKEGTDVINAVHSIPCHY